GVVGGRREPVVRREFRDRIHVEAHELEQFPDLWYGAGQMLEILHGNRVEAAKAKTPGAIEGADRELGGEVAARVKRETLLDLRRADPDHARGLNAEVRRVRAGIHVETARDLEDQLHHFGAAARQRIDR